MASSVAILAQTSNINDASTDSDIFLINYGITIVYLRQLFAKLKYVPDGSSGYGVLTKI